MTRTRDIDQALSHDQLRDIYRKRAPASDISSHSYALMGYRQNSYRCR